MDPILRAVLLSWNWRLDVIVILLVLTKIGEPIALEEARVDLDSLVALLEERAATEPLWRP